MKARSEHAAYLVSLAFMMAVVVAVACGVSKQAAVERAELSCLVTAGAEFSQQAIVASSAQQDGKIAVSLSIPTVLCMLQALGAQPPATSAALPARVDASP